MTDNIRVISDLEGFDIEMYFHDTYNLFVCGDIVDSTLVTALKGNFLESKSNNLKNILHCACNPNVRLLFGNRDLNKLKCKFLAELNETGDATAEFNNGNVNLSIKNYEILKEKINKENVWKVPNMNAWYTFWANVGNGKNWTESPKYTEQPFYDRFLEIFGADNAVKDGGTMSAQNLLQTIPYEIGIQHENNDYKAFIVLAIFKSMLVKSEKKITLTNVSPIKNAETSQNFNGWLYQMYVRKGNNLCCFLDYGINEEKENNFMYLFSHGGLPYTLLKNPELFHEIINYLEQSSELTDLLTNANSYYKVLPKGGFYKRNNDSVNVLSRDEIISSVSMLNNIVKDNINIVLGNEDNTEFDSETSSDLTEISSSDSSIESSVEICDGKSRNDCPHPPRCYWRNQKCQQQKGGATVDGQPTINMLFLLIISSGFNLLNFIKRITDVQLKETILNAILGDKERQHIENVSNLFPSSDQISPMSTGYKTIRKDTPFLDLSNVQLVQFIGHSPNGFGTTIDKCDTILSDESIVKTYIVNLDSSNTFYGSSLNKLDNDIKSKSYCKFKNNNYVKINTTLVLNLGEDQANSLVHVKFTDQLASNYKKNDTHKFITDHDLPSIPILEITSVLGSRILDEQIEFSHENNINIHGFCNILEEERIVFSMNESENSRNKNLYCLNYSNYKKFLGISEE
jgi:hypothetical protein